MIRAVIQNDGPSTVFLRTLAEETQSVVTETTVATTNGDAYLTVANVSGVRQGMLVTSIAATNTFAERPIVQRVEGSKVYLYGGEGSTRAVGTEVTFSFDDWAHQEQDYPRGIRLQPGDVYTWQGEPGSYPGKGGMVLSTIDTAHVNIIKEEN